MVTAISKRLCCIIGVLLILSFLIPQAHAAVQSVFGTNQYVRTNGNPNVYTDSFSAASGQGAITVLNGDENGNNRVTSASILLNGIEIFGPNNFKKKIYVLEAQVDLQASNSIEIILRSKPGSYLTVQIIQEGEEAPSVNINADPINIQAGQSSILTWTSINTQTCVIEPGIDTVSTSGSISVSPTETTTYTITATGHGGTATDAVTISVHQPPTVSISANPDAVLSGESATLSWISTNADTATIDQGIGNVAVNGSTPVSPTETTTYTITAIGPGETATASVTVTVTYPVPTVSISANPGEIQLGESSTLTWSSTNASSCVIEPIIGSVNPSGSLSVSPALTTTYTIAATGPGGTAVSNMMVTVTNPNAPPNVSFNAQPSSIELGGSSVLSWISTNAESAHIDNGIGPVSTAGSIVVSPEHTTTYTITVTGPTGSANAQVTVMVLGNPEPQPEGSFGKQYEDQIPPDATVVEYDPKRFSVITGLVHDIDDTPQPFKGDTFSVFY